MFEPNRYSFDELSDNGFEFSIPPGHRMSHNRQTFQDKESLVLERQLTRQNGGVA
jgi:hypothetical protein